MRVCVYCGHQTGDLVLPIMLHGDAAMAGQGIVYETMQLSRLAHYQTGGSLHVVTNNQVGFTTDPSDSRSTLHPSDIAKAFKAPVFHVNADNLFEVCRVFKMAVEYRQQFRTDVVINLIGYRRYGHNELDQPSFTQPVMYKTIASHPPVMDLTANQLVKTGVFQQAELDALLGEVESKIAAAFDNADSYTHDASVWLAGRWEGMRSPGGLTEAQPTGVSVDVLAQVGAKLVDVPKDMRLHSNVARIMSEKAANLAKQTNLDWGTVEALAFGSLLLEGNNVRISGQDAQRGTFSHRHAVLHDQDTGKQFCPMSLLSPGECNAPQRVESGRIGRGG